MNPNRERLSRRLTAAVLLVFVAAGEPMTQGDPGPMVTITGPTRVYAGTVADLSASATGFEDPVAFTWSIESGPAVIEPNGSSARVHDLGWGQVVVRVIADGGASGTAESTHFLEFIHNSGFQKPNDFNGDGHFDISDPASLLNHIFGGESSPLCGEGRLSHPSNLAIFDANASGEIDISDPVFMLNFLFLGGPTPANCSGDISCTCISILDCPYNEMCF